MNELRYIYHSYIGMHLTGVEGIRKLKVMLTELHLTATECHFPPITSEHTRL